MNIFVYGTLKKEYKDLNRSTQAFHKGTEWICNAAIEGSLYLIDWYPALKLSGSGLVHGEIYRITSADLLTYLDEYEGAITEEVYLQKIHKSTFEQVDYIRKKIVIDSIECWVYIYLGPVYEDTKIIDGIFKKL